MRLLLKLTTILLAGLALSMPAGALAASPSAGDQQYVDPLSGSHGGTSHTGSGSSGSSGSGSSSATGSGSTGSTGATGSTGSGTLGSGASLAATGSSSSASTGSSTATTGSSAGRLPYTGYDSWLAVVLGVGLVGFGLVLRRRVSHR